MFFEINVCYVIVLEVSRDLNMYIVNPRVIRRRPQGFSQPDHFSRNPRVLIGLKGA